jgi:superfamily II DNA/RNA helicase
MYVCHILSFVELPQKNKDSIIEALKHSNSTLRIVLSTSVLGMGFDVKEINWWFYTLKVY